MIVELKPYPAYKPSSIEWLEEIPAHWETRRLKSVVQQVSEQAEGLQESMPYVALENVESWTGQVTQNYAETIENQLKSFKSGDVLFGKLRPYLAKVMRAHSHGKCVGEFLVLRATNQISGHFLEHLLRSKPAIDWINSSTFGARMPRTDWQFVGSARFGVPPLPEQTAIARFLDHTTSRIERYIHARRKLIALLEEQKQVMIHQAVTGQMDVRTGQPYPTYKPSGVEWLGEVPSHWRVERLRVVACILNGATPATNKEEYWNGGILWLTPEDLGALDHSREITDCNRKITPEGHASCGTSLAEPNSIVLSTRAPIGYVGILTSEGCTNQGCKLIVPSADITAKYLCTVLESVRSELRSLGQGATFDEISRIKLANFRLPIPPISEQNTITSFLGKAITDIELASNRSKRQIHLLRAFRTRLIADVVTGKLDVRKVSTGLLGESGTARTGTPLETLDA